jgi:hypothetical protein
MLRLPRRTPSARWALRLLLGAAAIGAGVIHLAFAPEHVSEYLPLGLGFLVAGVLQIAWGTTVAVRESRRLMLVGAAGSLVFVAVYVMSRTVGLPLGPDAFRPEAFGAADLLCCALEVPVVIGACALARRPGALRGRLRVRLAAAVGAAFVLVGSATAYAAAAPGHVHGDGHQRSCPTAPALTGVRDARGVDTGVTAYFRCRLVHEHDAHHADAGG